MRKKHLKQKHITLTYKNRFNQALKNLKQDIDYSDCDNDDLEVLEILEPSCNLNFCNQLMRITKSGTIVTRQFQGDEEDEFIQNKFSGIIRFISVPLF